MMVAPCRWAARSRVGCWRCWRHANSPVSADRLIEGLWGDQEPTKSARPGVRTGEIKALRALSAVDGVRGQVEG